MKVAPVDAQLSVHFSIPKPKVVPGLMSKVEWLFKLIVLR
jgi:hypothetical protein